MQTYSKISCKEGIVREIHEDYLLVEVVLQSACAGCHAKGMCYASQGKNELMKTLIHDLSTSFQIGEKVTVYTAAKLEKRAVLLAYLLPLIILISTLLITYQIIQHELIATLMSVIFTTIYYIVIWLLNKQKKIDRQFVLYAKKVEE